MMAMSGHLRAPPVAGGSPGIVPFRERHDARSGLPMQMLRRLLGFIAAARRSRSSCSLAMSISAWMVVPKDDRGPGTARVGADEANDNSVFHSPERAEEGARVAAPMPTASARGPWVEGGGELARPKVCTPDAASCPLPSSLCNQRLLGGFRPAQLYRVSTICFCGIFGAFGTRCHVHGTVCHDWFRPSKCSDWPHSSSSPISISLLRVASVGQALKDDASDQNGPGFQSVSLLSHGDRARSLRGLGAGAQLGTDRQCWTTQDRLVHARSQLNAGRHLVDIDAYRDALGKAHR